MKAENLEYLFLDNNHLISIYPLFNTHFPNLKILCLNGNYFNYDILEEILKYKDLKDKEKTFYRNKLLIQFSCHISDIILFKDKFLNICYYCGKKFEDNKDILLYCYDCGKNFCRKCEVKHRETNNTHTKLIKGREKKNRCLEHYDEENNGKILDLDHHEQHEGHKIIKLEEYNKQYLENIEIIKKKINNY